MSADPTVPVLEVFSSFQGEGPRVGERQVFVRLARCDLRCAFCDTPESYPTPDRARVQTSADEDADTWPENPMTVADVLAAVERLDRPRGLHRAVSITGGEPLLHPKAVRALGLGARALGLRVHVETGGHRPGALRDVIDAIDEATPDLKLSSACGFPTPWEAHRETLALLTVHRKCLAVKAVVAATTTVAEAEEAARFAATHAPGAPLVLQPLSPREGSPAPPSPADLVRLHAAARRAHPDVRVIPQTHKMLGVR
ncbi:MAG TPA: 7-carboxy-7-deazaguanine synthase QueE [Planctomycetota bacterium]|nr:7-carboxy-7-deazaguanine synthase QueE [Planctomycetota bacterium]